MSGIVTTNTWYGTVIVVGDVVVPPGNTLTIEAGTRVRVVGGGFPLPTAITVNGSLNVQGTVEQPAVFTSNEAAPQPGDWGGIRLNSSTETSSLMHLVLERSTDGLVIAGGGQVQADYSTFRENKTADLQVIGSGPWNVAISHSIFSGSHGSGTAASPGYGIRMQQGTSGGITIGFNSFYDNGIGISAAGGGFTFARNLLRDNGIAVLLASAENVALQDNAIAHNQTGISTPLLAAPSAFTVQGNTIGQNSLYGWDNSGAFDINAAGNWWGSADPSVIAAAINDGADDPARGRVLVDPPAGGPSASAPPIDITPPITSIVSGPQGPTPTSDAVFHFTSEPGTTFECRLDGPAGAGAFTSCVSGQSYPALQDGLYTFYVRGTDIAENVETSPASRSFTIDTVAPAAPSITTPAEGSYSSSGVVVLSGTGEPGSTVAVYDGTASQGSTSADGSGRWAKTLSAVADGSHSYTATATDPAGNTGPASASVRVIVDSVAPDTTITAGPTGPTNDPTPTFTFIASETGATFACSIDSSAYGPCTGPGASHTTPALTESTHTLSVRATDPAGNTDPTPATRAFKVDMTAPSTTITSGPPAATRLTMPTFTFTASEPGSTYSCSLDGSAYGACGSAYRTPRLRNGKHTLKVRASDQAGNTDATPAVRTFTVDTIAPNTKITRGPVRTVSRTPTFTFSFKSTERGSSFSCSLDRGRFRPCRTPYKTVKLRVGRHTLKVRATDPAGNTDPTPATRTVDIIAR